MQPPRAASESRGTPAAAMAVISATEAMAATGVLAMRVIAPVNCGMGRRSSSAVRPGWSNAVEMGRLQPG